MKANQYPGWTFFWSFCALLSLNSQKAEPTRSKPDGDFAISGSNTGDTLLGTQSDQLILGGTADSIGSQYSNSCLVGSDGNDSFFVNSTVGPAQRWLVTLVQIALTSGPTA